jgi:23S rRNA pseudouridine2605 synthase
MSRSSSSEPGVRLNRYLASCGLGSRRKCEDHIREGRIEVNGKVVLDLATRVLPGDYVRHDGRVVRQEEEITLLVNKPKGYICTHDDPEGRKTVFELIPPKFRHLNHVGRLDFESRGLLLLTNSGTLNATITHPRHAVQKEYHVTLDHPFDPGLTPRLTEGIRLSEGLARAESVRFHSRKKLTMVLGQGYNRQIRRMFAKLGYKVRDLERVRIGSLTVPDLAEGGYRVLNSKDLGLACQNPAPPKPRKSKVPPPA